MNQEKNIHVLYIPAWLPTGEDQFGGSFILDQANALRKHTAAQVGFIYRQDIAIRKKKKVILSYLEPFDHIVVAKPYVPKVTGFTIRIWCSQYYDAFERYIKRFGIPEVIHAHSFVAGFAARHISRKCGIPFLLTEHLTSFIEQKITRAHKGTLAKVLKEAEDVVAVSNCLREAISTHTARSIVMIPNLFDEEIFMPSTAPTKSPFKIVSVGDLIPRKGFDALIDAFKIAFDRDKDIRLEIIGIGPLRKNLEEQVFRSNLTSQVVFRGACTPDEVAKAMQMSHLCISTSHLETFGITLIEAMACGVPILATPSGGPDEIVTHQTGILTANWNPETVANEILSMKQNSTKFDHEKIAEYAMGHYGSKVVAAQIFRLYEKALRN